MLIKIKKTNKEWRKILRPEEYHILREKGTEKAFSGKYLDNKRKGIYLCTGCKNLLFSSNSKFDSGSGWPSFYRPLSEKSLIEKIDKSHGMTRTEVLCNRCGGHLGHVFDDGPKPTGKRFCINSIALKFVKKEYLE